MSPGDPVRNMYSANGVMPTEEMVEQTREEMGLNDPFVVQYGRWLGNCLHGDFGTSYSLNKPVTELLCETLADFKINLNVYADYADFICTARNDIGIKKRHVD